MATQRFYDGQPGPDIRRELNNFEAILDGTVAAAQDASTDAISASVKAQRWADAAPGVEVETGKYSAKHWAARAQTTVTGGLIYRGSHSAASGAYPATPSLGDYYKISAAGTLGGVGYSVGDSIIYNGTGWDKIDSTDAVTSVAGRVGAVVLTKGDVGLSNVDNTSDANKPVSTATQTALNGKEPTIAAGTVTQYRRGDKTWRDFFTDVRAATLTGLSTATNAVVAATDTVLAAIGKLQAQVSAKFDKTGGDVGGNINFTGPGRRITGDFSNAIFANRAMLQTSTPNANTDVGILPNGVATSAGLWFFNNGANLNNTAFLRSYINGATDVRFESGRVGDYSFLPITFHTGNAERMRIDSSGNVLVTSAVLGYGVGAGGIVVQATSKSTDVALNKPCGRINMHAAALAGDSSVRFNVNNTFVGDTDEISVWLSNPIRPSAYDVTVDGIRAGVFGVRLRNITATSGSDSVVLGFAVRKGATS